MKRENVKKIIKKDKDINKNIAGITLIALVVTIIVLIILAGVSINLLLGKNGIITKAKEGKTNYEIASREESEKLSNVVNYMENEEYQDDLANIEIYGKMYAYADGREVLVLSSNPDYEETSSELTLKEDYGNVGNKRYRIEYEEEYIEEDENGNKTEYSGFMGIVAPWINKIEYEEEWDGMNHKWDDYGNPNLVEVKITDKISPASTSGWFFDCANLATVDLTNLDTSNVKDMSYMFWKCSKLKSLDVSNFDTSNVQNMNSMFQSCNISGLDISNFNTQNVTDMGEMFSRCSLLTSIDVTNFDTRNVKNMYRMFEACRSLTSIDVTNFDTTNVTDMGGIFEGCERINKYRCKQL